MGIRKRRLNMGRNVSQGRQKLPAATGQFVANIVLEISCVKSLRSLRMSVARGSLVV